MPVVGSRVLVVIGSPQLGVVKAAPTPDIYTVELDDQPGVQHAFAGGDVYDVPLPKTRIYPRGSQSYYWVVMVQQHGGDMIVQGKAYTRLGQSIDGA